MRRTILKKSIAVGLIGLTVFAAACTPPAGNTVITANTNLSNNQALNGNLSGANNSISSNANSMPINQSAAIDTKEPEQYQATVSLRFTASGAQNVATPPIKAEVARNGADRRMEFVMPNGEKLIYLDRAGKQLVISPNRKQYAELTKDALGFEVRQLLLPEQIVNQVKQLKGVERVGEEKLDGRDVVKYRYGATTNTQTQAGAVATESVILVDKETGLPLRSETVSQSQGNVQGISGISAVTEMSNIRTVADAALFNEPTDLQKVEPEQIRQQVNLVFSAALAIIGQMMKSAQPPPTATPNS